MNDQSYSQRLYLRSDEELEMQNKGLIELSILLTKMGIIHYLSSGTLLGAIREKDFIRWDWDVQFYFRTEDVLTRFDEIIARLKENGFEPYKTDNTIERFKICARKYNTDYEMTAWRKEGEQRVRSDWNLPARFFDLNETIDFRGRIYQCMCPPIDYLVHCYGNDWRLPKRIDRKEDYLAASFYKNPAWMRRCNKLLRQVYYFIKNVSKKRGNA